MVMPGEDAEIEIEMIKPFPVEKGQRFTVREGNKTVGTGLVLDVLE